MEIFCRKAFDLENEIYMYKRIKKGMGIKTTREGSETCLLM